MFQPVPHHLEQKDIWLRTRDASFEAVLAELLRFWGYRRVETPQEASLLLLERDLEPPLADKPALRLGGEEPAALCLPLAIDRFWGELESRFHRSPRKHIRIAAPFGVRVSFRGETHRSQTVNLTDMGARLSCPAAPQKDETLLVYLMLGKEVLRLTGRVIYLMPKEELRGWPSFDVGLIFEQAGEEQRLLLRDTILETYLVWVRESLGEKTLEAALPFFDLSKRVVEHLLRTRRPKTEGPQD